MRTKKYICSLCLLLCSLHAQAVVYTVNETLDKPDASLADGKCSTVLNPAPTDFVCSLRAAVMQGNAVPEAQAVDIVLEGGTDYLLTRTGQDIALSSAGDLDVRRPMTISAPLGGPSASVVGTGSDGLFDISHASGVSRVFNIELAFGKTSDGTGAAIQSSGNLELAFVDVHDNRASFGTRPVISHSGGLLHVNASRIHDNGAANEGVRAIGLNGGTAFVEGTTIDGNFGVAINARPDSALKILSSTIVDNTGAAVVGLDADVKLFNATIVDNGSSGVAQVSITETVQGNIDALMLGNIIGNLPGPACDIDVKEGGFSAVENIFADHTCNVAEQNLVDNVFDTTVVLAPLGDAGGPTPTRPPLAASVAIDFVSKPFCIGTFDQRGESRTVPAFQGGEPRCDAGAVEVQTQPNPELSVFADGFEGV